RGVVRSPLAQRAGTRLVLGANVMPADHARAAGCTWIGVSGVGVVRARLADPILDTLAANLDVRIVGPRLAHALGRAARLLLTHCRTPPCRPGRSPSQTSGAGAMPARLVKGGTLGRR